METSTTLLLISIAVIAIVLFTMCILKSESFQHIALPASTADLPDGTYIITSNSGINLASNYVTPVQCNNFLYNNPIKASNKTSWNLQRVADGVYMLKKPDGKECLYTNIDRTIRSFVFDSGCNKKNLCGVSKPSYTGNLDENSLHTYFMIMKHPNNKFYIKSMSNDMYFTLSSNGTLSLLKEPTEDSLFSFNLA
jgi:hypothetical protein